MNLAVLSVGLGAIVLDGTNIGVALPAIIPTPDGCSLLAASAFLALGFVGALQVRNAAGQGGVAECESL